MIALPGLAMMEYCMGGAGGDLLRSEGRGDI